MAAWLEHTEIPRLRRLAMTGPGRSRDPAFRARRKASQTSARLQLRRRHHELKKVRGALRHLRRSPDSFRNMKGGHQANLWCTTGQHYRGSHEHLTQCLGRTA